MSGLNHKENPQPLATLSGRELPRVGVLHRPGAAATLREIFLAARGICRPILLFDAKVATANEMMIEAARHLFEVRIVHDPVDLERSASKFEGIVAFHDSDLEAVDEVMHLGDGLLYEGRPASRWDKLVQRAALRSAGHSSILALPVDSVGDFKDAADAIGTPAVLKPRREMSGRGISFLATMRDFDHQIADKRDWNGLMLEEHIPEGNSITSAWLGNFVSVETASDTTGHHHLALFDKLPIAVRRRAGPNCADLVFVTGDMVPSRLPRKTQESIVAKTHAALTTLGVTRRVTHTELHVSDSAIEVIEVNGRVGGHLRRLLDLVNGPDLVSAALKAAHIGKLDGFDTATDGFAAGVFPAFMGSGEVLSNVTRGRIRDFNGVRAVEKVAAFGDSRAATEYRLFNVTIHSNSREDLDERVVRLITSARDLFSADGMDQDPWIEALLNSCGDDGRPSIR